MRLLIAMRHWAPQFGNAVRHGATQLSPSVWNRSPMPPGSGCNAAGVRSPISFGQIKQYSNQAKPKRRQKSKKKLALFLVKLAVVFELGIFFAFHDLWTRMNKSTEFRLYMRDNYPYFLEYYYNIGEYMGDLKIREQDAALWSTAEATAPSILLEHQQKK